MKGKEFATSLPKFSLLSSTMQPQQPVVRIKRAFRKTEKEKTGRLITCRPIALKRERRFRVGAFVRGACQFR